jgi:hypothetical protein
VVGMRANRLAIGYQGERLVVDEGFQQPNILYDVGLAGRVYDDV